MPIWHFNQQKIIMRLLGGVTVRTVMATLAAKTQELTLTAHCCDLCKRASACLHGICNCMGVAFPHADILHLTSYTLLQCCKHLSPAAGAHDSLHATRSLSMPQCHSKRKSKKKSKMKRPLCITGVMVIHRNGAVTLGCSPQQLPDVSQMRLHCPMLHSQDSRHYLTGCCNVLLSLLTGDCKEQ